MCFASPYLIIAIVPVIIFYGWFERFYRKTSIEIQRLEALSRAPIFSHINETISNNNNKKLKIQNFIKKNKK